MGRSGIKPAQPILGLLEEGLDVRFARDVRLDGDASASSAVNLVYHPFSLARVAGVVHDDGEAVARQSLRDRTSDSARSTRDNRTSTHDGSSV